MHHIILLSACSITATINTVKSCIMKSYNGRPFPKKAYQIQILLAIWPNKFHFLNFTLCVCVDICLCVCAQVCICLCCVCMHVSGHLSVCMCTSVCLCVVCVCVYVDICVYVLVCVHVDMYVQVFVITIL